MDVDVNVNYVILLVLLDSFVVEDVEDREVLILDLGLMRNGMRLDLIIFAIRRHEKLILIRFNLRGTTFSKISIFPLPIECS